LPQAQIGEHVFLAQIGRPLWSELKMRFVLNRFPVASPLKPKIRSKKTDCLVLGRLVEVPAVLEYANVEGDSKIVIGVSATRVSYDLAWLGSSLCVEIVLFVICPKAADYFDGDSVGSCFCDKCARVWLHFREQRSNHSFTSIVHLIE